MLQSWVPRFNFDNLSNLAFPIGVSLRNMPFKHHDQALTVSKTLGEVIGMDNVNENTKDPIFCINLEISKGWATYIDLECEGGILPQQNLW